jgi:hypothetical protein
LIEIYLISDVCYKPGRKESKMGLTICMYLKYYFNCGEQFGAKDEKKWRWLDNAITGRIDAEGKNNALREPYTFVDLMWWVTGALRGYVECTSPENTECPSKRSLPDISPPPRA